MTGFYEDPIQAIGEAIEHLRAAMVIVNNVQTNEYGYIGAKAKVLKVMYSHMYKARECYIPFLSAKDE